MIGSVCRLIFAILTLCALFTPERVNAQGGIVAQTEPEAHLAFETGLEAYDEGRFSEALSQYERAYALSGRSVLLFNIGRAAEQDGRHERALASYEQYLQAVPNAENRRFVERRIAKIRELLVARPASPRAQAQVSAAPVYAPPEPTPEALVAGAGLKGALQLGLSIKLLNFEHNTTKWDEEQDLEHSAFEWGQTLTINLECAYGLTPRLVFGGVLWLGGDAWRSHQSDGAESKRRSSLFALGPKLDYMLAEPSRFSPFLGGALLLTRWSSKYADAAASTDLGFEVLGRFGLRSFLADALSIDAALVFGVSRGWISDGDRTGFEVGIDIGLSGWLRS